MRLMVAVRAVTNPCRARCTSSRDCCSSVLAGTKRMFGRPTASHTAAASAASFLGSAINLLDSSTMNTQHVRVHWFFLVAPVVVAIDLYVALSARGDFDRILEAGLLFDLVVLVPCLYWLCYRQRGKKAAVRAAALACLGIWAALKLVPEAERDLLNYVAPLRYVGLAALVWLELVVVLAIYKSVFKGASVSQVASQAPADMPPWVAKLLAMEAKFWLKVWGVIKRCFGK